MSNENSKAVNFEDGKTNQSQKLEEKLSNTMVWLKLKISDKNRGIKNKFIFNQCSVNDAALKKKTC